MSRAGFPGLAQTVAIAALCSAFAAGGSAQQRLPVPPGGDAALACGQKPDGRAYWVEYAFCDLPAKAPGKAKGLIFWSHGVSGDRPQYQSSVPSVIRRLAQAGWEVRKIDRNNLYENCRTAAGNVSNCWSVSGVKHAEDLVARAREARAQGYDKVIAAGQSFGGAISLEANTRAPDLFYAVIAFSPGHGSDAPVANGGWSPGAYYNLDKQLLDVLSAQKSGRVVLLLPPHDAYSPNRDGDPIWPRARQALQDARRPFVLLGDGLPVAGHGAASTNQFNTWFGECIRTFVEPGQLPPAGETRCPLPAALPVFFMPADLKVPVAGSTGSTRWLGAWRGSFLEDKRELAIVVERIDGQTASVVYSIGAGPNHEQSMGFERHANARVDGNRITVDRGSGRTLELALSADGASVTGQHKSGSGNLAIALSRVANMTELSGTDTATAAVGPKPLPPPPVVAPAPAVSAPPAVAAPAPPTPAVAPSLAAVAPAIPTPDGDYRGILTISGSRGGHTFMSIALSVSGNAARGQIVDRLCGAFPANLAVSPAGEISGSVTALDGAPQACTTEAYSVSGKLNGGVIELELRRAGARGRASLRKG